jgi:hypothetical protein
MNEILLKKIIKLKLNTAETVINQLPPEISKGFKEFGRIIFECVNEGFQETTENPSEKSKSSNKLNNISIE